MPDPDEPLTWKHAAVMAGVFLWVCATFWFLSSLGGPSEPWHYSIMGH